MSGVWQWLTDPSHWTGDDGIVHHLVEHLVISGWALVIALVIALPPAVWLGHLGRGGSLLAAVSSIGRAIPTYAVIVTLAMTDQIGVDALAVVLALALFAMPPLLVNTYVAMTDVDPDVKDAARGMGMTPWQVVRRVELPLAFPLAFAGFRTAAIQVVATATFAGLVGAGTLGKYVYEGFAVHDYDELYAGVLLVAVLCIVLERLFAGVERVVARRTGQAGPRRGPGMVEAAGATVVTVP